MKANQLLLAAIHPRLPIEGELPSLGCATAWLNSLSLTPADLREKVVLVDFWTYTCTNWLRQLPYVAKHRREWEMLRKLAGEQRIEKARKAATAWWDKKC